MKRGLPRPNRREHTKEHLDHLIECTRRVTEREGRGQKIEHTDEELKALIQAAEKGADEGTMRMDERERKYNEK